MSDTLSSESNRLTTIFGQGPRFNQPQSIVVDSKGNLYIADSNNHRILKMNYLGEISIVAGTGAPGDGADGGLATNTNLNSPSMLALDSADNLYIGDNNHCIRKVNSDNTIQTVACANHQAGFSGDGGPAINAQIAYPSDIAFDRKDNLYILDNKNSRIRKVDKSSGIISTVAGMGIGDSSAGDGGPATKAGFNNPIRIAIDNKDNIYMLQLRDHRVRKVDAATGIITTFAGGNGSGFSGDGGLATQARLNYPSAIATDSNGKVYIADANNNRIRVIDNSGNISTVPLNLPTNNNTPYFKKPLTGFQVMAADRQGNLYIIELDNNLIRKIELEQHSFSIDIASSFSVIAVVSPETFKKNDSGKIESGIATGNIASKYAPYQNKAGGWQLSIVADPPNKAKGTYISFAVYAKATEDGDVNKCEILAQLQNKYIPASRSTVEKQKKEQDISNTVFTKYTHTIAAVKDKNKITLYLDGSQLGDPMPYTGIIDVNNTEPLNIGKLLPEPEDKAQQGAIVRKLSLWDKELSQTEIINYTNCMMATNVNFPMKVDYEVIYNTPKQPAQDFTIQIKGTLSITGKTGIAYNADIDKTQKFTPRTQYLDNRRLLVGQKLLKTATLKDLGKFTFEEIWDNTAFIVTIKASLPDLSDPQKPQLTAQDTFPYEPEVLDIYHQIVGEAAQKLVQQANAGQNEVTYQYDGALSNQVFAKIELGKMPNCAGFWNLYGKGQENGLDTSANRNDVPSSQRTSPKELLTVLPLQMEDQVKDNWCWAACSLSVKKFYDASSKDTQCQVVTKMFQDPLMKSFGPSLGPPKPLATGVSCNCTDADGCNHPYAIFPLLKKLNLYGNWVKPSFDTINDMLGQGRPIVIWIKWQDGLGHFAVISGHYRETTKDGQTDCIVINDPFFGMSTIMTMGNTLSINNYMQTGSWEGTYYTRPVWINPSKNG